jgi:hypothetical protein
VRVGSWSAFRGAGYSQCPLKAQTSSAPQAVHSNDSKYAFRALHLEFVSGGEMQSNAEAQQPCWHASPPPNAPQYVCRYPRLHPLLNSSDGSTVWQSTPCRPQCLPSCDCGEKQRNKSGMGAPRLQQPTHDRGSQSQVIGIHVVGSLAVAPRTALARRLPAAGRRSCRCSCRSCSRR